MKDTSLMTKDELREYRRTLFRDAASLDKRPDRIPHLSFYITWPVMDAGFKLSEGLHDWDKMTTAITQHQEKYNFDAMQCYGTRNPVKITESMGIQNYSIDDERGIISIDDRAMLSHDDLKVLAEDPLKAQWEIGLKNKFPLFQPGITTEPFENAIKAQKEYFAYTANINRIMKEDYAVPPATSPLTGFASPGAEALFGFLRGIKGFSIDMRKDISLVKECINALDRTSFDVTIANLENCPDGPDPETCFDFLLLSLAHTVMSNKQFEELIWNKLGKFTDRLVEKGKLVRVYMHGPMDRFYDYFADYPKGSLVIMAESNELQDIKKNLPNAAVCGGLTTTLMGHATPDECVAHTKKLIDELGDQGLIISLNTMGSYPGDTLSANLKAVSEFIRSYEIA